jgi:glyoxylase-like metal-dependent hydrolase (beta-lactamase superfamily II)
MANRIHHLNCISTCPLGGALMDGRSLTSLRGRLACHCILVEADDGLVLLDTGFGLRDVADPWSRLSKFFLALLRPDFREEMTAYRQIQRLGFDPRDVRHIVLTHLDFDHAGGLDDFPEATVHLLSDERDSAAAQRTLLDRMRYRPAQWSTRANWRVYPKSQGEAWFGFDCVRDLEGAPRDILLVPLIGHTLGHAGIAVRRSEDEGAGAGAGAGGGKRDAWLLLTGDAYFYHAEMDLERPRCTPGLQLYQVMMEKDREARLANQARLRELKRAHGGEVTILCSHDIVEFERLARRAHNQPAGAGAMRESESGAGDAAGTRGAPASSGYA